MFSKTMREISRPQWLDILASLKRSKGKAVGEISEELGKSYMGIKQHCDSMARRGLLETFRRPRDVGRPEKIYRLTNACDPLFPQEAGAFSSDLLKAVADVYGKPAVEKLLFNLMQSRAERYRKKVRGKSVVERATLFAKLREEEGYSSRVAYDKEKGFRIEEYHNPLGEMFKAHPILAKAEDRMIEQVLGTKVTREVWKSGGQHICVFSVSTL